MTQKVEIPRQYPRFYEVKQTGQALNHVRKHISGDFQNRTNIHFTSFASKGFRVLCL